MIASPISPPSRRPPFLTVAIFMIFAVLSFQTIHYYSAYERSPLFSSHSSKGSGDGSWLILTISKASHLQRRHMIRNTWQKLYGGTGLFDARFVIADPGPTWHPLIEQENATHGDLIMLPHEHETKTWGMTIKALEAFEWLANPYGVWHRPYTFVSRIDEDSWLDARTFHEHWLAPRVRNHTTHGTWIGREVDSGYPFKYTGSQFYTMSWDMMVKAVELWHTNYIHDEHEDILLGRLFYEADERYNITTLPPRVSFDYDESGETGDGTAWSSPLFFVDDQANHAITAGSINPSNLERDDIFMRVAACFDENGVALSDNEVEWSKHVRTVAAWKEEDGIREKFGR